MCCGKKLIIFLIVLYLFMSFFSIAKIQANSVHFDSSDPDNIVMHFGGKYILESNDGGELWNYITRYWGTFYADRDGISYSNYFYAARNNNRHFYIFSKISYDFDDDIIINKSTNSGRMWYRIFVDARECGYNHDFVFDPFLSGNIYYSIDEDIESG
ncbi:hypothetical protein JXI42_13975 [bacterium]|nr:hypothetical protein [bacterium]